MFLVVLGEHTKPNKHVEHSLQIAGPAQVANSFA